MSADQYEPVAAPATPSGEAPAPPLIFAMILREEGITGVQSYVQRLRRSLAEVDIDSDLLTAFSWGGRASLPVFGLRLAIEKVSRPASVVWYRHWHEAFLRRALRRRLAEEGECVVFAQEPLAARAALRARRGPHQRVVMAVHFRVSQADEWADKKEIRRGGRLFGAIRALERDVIPQLDGLGVRPPVGARCPRGLAPRGRGRSLGRDRRPGSSHGAGAHR